MVTFYLWFSWREKLGGSPNFSTTVTFHVKLKQGKRGKIYCRKYTCEVCTTILAICQLSWIISGYFTLVLMEGKIRGDPPNSNLSLTFRCENSFHYVSLSLSSFDLRQSELCEEEKLKVVDNNAAAANSTVFKGCGLTRGNLTTLYQERQAGSWNYLSAGNAVVIRLNSSNTTMMPPLPYEVSWKCVSKLPADSAWHARYRLSFIPPKARSWPQRSSSTSPVCSTCTASPFGPRS